MRFEENKMMLKLQKRLAASVLRCSPKRVVFDPASIEDIKEAITKTDIRLLIGEGAIWRLQEKGVSRARANKRKVQKSKGLRRGEGKRKGKYTARAPKKQAWMNKIRSQRSFLRHLRQSGMIKKEHFKELYRQSKGGYFRSIKHIKLHITDQGMLLKPSGHEPARSKLSPSKPSAKVRKNQLKNRPKLKAEQAEPMDR